MTRPHRATAHDEHGETQSEHKKWLEDIERWRVEHRRAADMLGQVQAALLDHEPALDSHAETVRGHELYLERHQPAVAGRELSGSETDQGKLADSHRDFQAKHDQAREAHRRIGMYHGRVTAEVARLLDRLNAPM
jgi:hypothetical protein